MRIAFLGTPDFARASLKALLDEGRDIAAVFTQPDRPRGRGMRLAPSPVKELAEASGIPVYQPETFSDGAAAGILREVRPDLTVAVAYGRLLPEDFLSVPKLGSINLHGSLLPRWRGAAPIQWAILSGDRITGVTVQYMAKEMDAGDIISRRETFFCWSRNCLMRATKRPAVITTMHILHTLICTESRTMRRPWRSSVKSGDAR